MAWDQEERGTELLGIWQKTKPRGQDKQNQSEELAHIIHRSEDEGDTIELHEIEEGSIQQDHVDEEQDRQVRLVQGHW